MSFRTTSLRGRVAIAAVTALSTTAAAFAGGAPTTLSAAPSQAATHRGMQGLGLGEPTLAQFASTHLNRRSTAIVNQREKLNGGESPIGQSQEQYDNRAYPATDISPAQVATARAAFARHGRGAKGFTAVGPDGGEVPGLVTYTGQPSNVSGRSTALLPLGDCSLRRCLVLVGTAGGGLWRTTDALANSPTWTPVGSGLTSNAIGSLTLAGGVVYAGTGEPNGSSDSEAGTGLFSSTDNGSTFTRISTTTNAGEFAVGRSLDTIVIDRAQPAHWLVGTAVARHGSSAVNGGRFTPPGAAPVGIYETINSGKTWTATHNDPSDTPTGGSANGGDYFRGGVSRIQQDPTDAGTFYASVFDYGLFRKTADTWTNVFASSAGDPAQSLAARTEFIAVPKANKTRIYLGDATTGPEGKAGLWRTDDALAETPLFTLLSSADKKQPGYASYNFCSAQCSYDMPVSSPPGQPDVVFIGGQMQYDEIFSAHPPTNGRAVQRSSDAGLSFTDMTNDTANNGLHPDQHAIAYAGDAVLLASDGGINRLSGGFTDHSADCTSRALAPENLILCRRSLSAIPVANTAINKGLQSLQFQSVSLSSDGKNLLAGAQDNGTWSFDRRGGSSLESVGGDGGQSGFDATDSSIRYHSYYGATHDVNFAGSDPAGWDYISQPLSDSGEAASFYTPLVADPVVGGTLFDGLQHVWRTTDNGGSRATLDKHCNELTGDFSADYTCGDFRPLGGSIGGDLTGPAYGSDKGGSYVVAISRSTTDHGTMWVATRRGRIFVTHNADAVNPTSVAFARVDSAATPERFVSGLSIDPADANHVVASYSGYDAYARTAGTATGHVFDLRSDGAATDVTGDLGDQPVTSVLVDWAHSTTYIGTDFGVLGRGGSSTTWGSVPGLPVVSVYGLTYDAKSRSIYAATHGRGIWAAKL